MLMHILRRVALTVLSPLFVFLVMATAIIAGFARTAMQPEAVKGLVAESGLYDTIVPSLLQQQKVISTPLGSISASDPAVQKAAGQAVPPKYVQQNAETAIDSLYAWLDGKVSQPSLNFNFGEQNSVFADNIAAGVQQKLAGLPACSTAQSITIARSGSFDALNATCLPRGVTAAGVAQQVKAYMNSNGSFLDKPLISTTDFKDDKGRSIFNERYKDIPIYYQLAKKMLWILAMLTALVGIGIVLLSATRAAGLKHIGLNLLIVGLLILIFSWVLNRTVNTSLVPKITIGNAALQQGVRNLATDLTRQIDKNYWFFGGLYVALGTLAVGSSLYLSKRNRPSAATQTAVRKKS